MAAEGVTEYGHMITCARSDSPWGVFESCPHNPVITNRNKAPFIIQGIGHGDLIRDKNSDWHILCLGFRQIHMWMPYHHLGREVFLIPAGFDNDGWLYAGKDGTCDFEYDIKGDFAQKKLTHYTLSDIKGNVSRCFYVTLIWKITIFREIMSSSQARTSPLKMWIHPHLLVSASVILTLS